ncbi:MAG: malate/lactate/ureidoglycolate dehydrogenase [Burkholderiales bacterium]|nr:malate/lactate/ureidoglycolate dehydrogenase [Burkholderiales bacterium]
MPLLYWALPATPDPVAMSAAHIVIPPADLTAFVAAIVAAAGSAPREAELVSTNLVLANLSGHDSHGVGLVPAYVEFVKGGGLLANQHAKLTSDTGALLMIDGCKGYGQVIGHEAMQLGIARARAHGMALVALRNSHHIGRIGQWAEDCAAAGLVSIHFVNALLRPLVAPFGGSDARFATNPFCVGVPRASAPPVILDFATSRIALGKVRVAMQSEREVAPGTLIDGRGFATNDPHVMFEADATGRLGAILPFGEHKGYGMALICEILGGALSGGETLHGSEALTGIYNNMLSIVIDPARLGAASFGREMEAFIDWVRASPAAPGFDRVRIAGEPELEMRAHRAAGIPIDVNTWADMQAAAASAGLAPAGIARFAGLARPA